MDPSNVVPAIPSSEPADVQEQTIQLTEKNTNSYIDLEEQVMKNFQKTTLPNVNVPEKIIICFDACYDVPNSVYRLGDGTTYSPINMLKRVLDFFLHSKIAINKRSEFALIVLKDSDPCYLHSFTNNIKDIISAVDYINSEESSTESFDFRKLFQVIVEEIEIPEYKQTECLQPPPYIVRMLMLYARSNCIPVINQEDPYYKCLKEQPYLYIDILYAHEEDCALHKCEEIYDALQDLDNGYSYVFEVSRNATKIHDCIAKLLAHPLQRPLQKHTDYSFSFKY